MTPDQRIRRARRALYLLTSLVLVVYGVVVITLGTIEIFHERGNGLLFTVAGLVGIWVYLRWVDKRALRDPDPAADESADALDKRG